VEEVEAFYCHIRLKKRVITGCVPTITRPCKSHHVFHLVSKQTCIFDAQSCLFSVEDYKHNQRICKSKLVAQAYKQTWQIIALLLELLPAT